MAIILVLAGFAAVLVLSNILRGWVLSYLWGWFIVPLGVHPISISWAIGLAVLFTCISGGKPPAKTDDDASKRLAMALGLAFIAPVLALAIGWMAHSIMVS